MHVCTLNLAVEMAQIVKYSCIAPIHYVFLIQATSLGAIMSIVCLSTMAILFFSETYAFLTTNVVTSISLDDNPESQIRLNFNVTMLDLHCDYASVDVLDALGTNRQNITKHVEKWQLDSEGTRRIFSGRNREMREVLHEEHDETLEQMHADGHHAVPLTAETFDKFLEISKTAFINFYAPWCVWCQRLHPTWEKFAEQVEDEELDVRIGIVDCVAEMQLCRDKNIRAFPSLRWFQDGKPVAPDYKQDRTVSALVGFTKRKLEMTKKYAQVETVGVYLCVFK